jgi:hypothetical protein
MRYQDEELEPIAREEHLRVLRDQVALADVRRFGIGTPATDMASRVRRRPRLGGLLNFYARAA